MDTETMAAMFNRINVTATLFSTAIALLLFCYVNDVLVTMVITRFTREDI
jgi:uncharacterized membrane protein